MHAIILSIGDELVLGQSVDTNSAYLSQQLCRRGIGTLYHQTVDDDQPEIVAALIQASQRAELVIVTGGLGPTDDDLTRQALAQAMGVELVLHEPSLQAIRAMYARRGRPMPEKNVIQAMQPRTAEAIPNSCGTAPGIDARLGNARIFVTPGVPREMLAMFEISIAPVVDQMAGGRFVILTAKVNTFGMGESDLAEKLGTLMDRRRNPKVGTTVGDGVVSVRVRSEFPSRQEAQAGLDDTIQQVEDRLGPIVYGREDQALQESLVSLLKQQGVKLATAESCTGGLLGKMVTDVSGSSAVYLGGWVTYADAMKQSQLGVSAELLAQHGAVSGPVAAAMARGALERSGADLALSITGVAGPEGGTPEKPVGLVYIGLAGKRNAQPIVDARALMLPGQRDIVRDRAAKSAAQLLRFHLMGLPLETFTWGRKA